jgi:PBP1b-binding outer membrane lipoprotein LpoB
MKKLHQIMIVFLTLAILHSCSEPVEEQSNIMDTTTVSSEEFSIKSLEEINNPLLSNQLKASEKHLKQLIARNFKKLLIAHTLNDLTIDTENILVSKNADHTNAYLLLVTVPHANGELALNLNAHLTMNFDDNVNIENQLEIGYQMEHVIVFNEKGKIIEGQPKYYTPKPSNIPSKAPKSVICQFANSLIGLNGYCGWGVGIGGPPPQYIIDMFNLEGYDSDDLYMLNKLWYQTDFTQVPFAQYNSILKDEIIDYYDTERMDYAYGGQPTYYSNFDLKTLGYHIHKQAFLDSFQEWFFQSLDPANSQTTYTYLVQNPTVLVQVFNLFADLNLNSDMDEGAYLNVPYGGYSQYPNVRCLTLGSQYLLSAAGLSLLQQLGSGAITIEQFKNSLPGCD